jgi:hypothetical protein
MFTCFLECKLRSEKLHTVAVVRKQNLHTLSKDGSDQDIRVQDQQLNLRRGASFAPL